jgi:DNA mismatch repair protein MutL
MVSQLFATKTPTYTPDGQRVISMISDQDIEKKMQ